MNSVWSLSLGALPLSCLLGMLVGCSYGGSSASSAASESADWTIPLGSYAAVRHSPLKQIDKNNAAKLRMAWSMSTGTLRGQEGQPLVVGNMMYFQSSFPNYVYAIDLDDVGKIAWKFAPELDKFAPSVACCDVVNRGVAYADGKILAAALDTKLYALDAKTGNVLWTATNGDPKLGQTMTSAPLVVHDKVIVGIAGGEYGVRGYITAYDLNTGKQIWRA
jgi:glucose dehydrogenase